MPSQTPTNITDQNTKTPQVSIGMPVYNGESLIREALDSLLAQNFTDFELIISDNASTDGTEAICQEYTANDTRIRYVRQAENRGATANFQFVLDEAVGEYFMWAGDDDYWEKDHLTKCLNYLKNNNDISAYATNVKIDHRVGFRSGVKKLIEECPLKRQKKFLQYPGQNSIFYSVFRKKTLNNMDINNYSYEAGDWKFIFDYIRENKMDYDENYVGMSRTLGKSEDYKKYSFVKKIKNIFILKEFYFSFSVKEIFIFMPDLIKIQLRLILTLFIR